MSTPHRLRWSSPYWDRNVEIAILALTSGLSLRSIGNRFNLSTERCRQITSTFCRRLNFDVWEASREGMATVSMRFLRDHRYLFIKIKSKDQ